MAIEVQTTQNVIIEYEPAGLGNRMLAAIIDYLLFALWYLAWYGIFALGQWDFFKYIISLWESGDYMVMLFFYILILAPPTFYDLFCEYFYNGQSLGKKLIKIRVVKTDGTPASFGAYLLRWLFRPIDLYASSIVGLPGMVGLVTILTTKKNQRLGDIVAGTTVVDLKGYKKDDNLLDFNLNFKEDYEVLYPDILNRLADKDIQNIISIIDTGDIGDDIIDKLADRITQITGYKSVNTNNILFLRKIVDDYNYLAIQ